MNLNRVSNIRQNELYNDIIKHRHVLLFIVSILIVIAGLIGIKNFSFADEPVDSYTLKYDGNGSDVVGSMAGLEKYNVSAGDDVYFDAPNYSRQGYGFAGWSFDSSATVDNGATIYGPRVIITAPEQYQSEVKIYAVWVPVSGTLQNFTARQCNSMTAATYNSATQTMQAGSVIALEDTRDGNVYTVARLADGKCWTIENLRLDLTNTNLEINAENTNNPADGFMSKVAEKLQTGETWAQCNARTAECYNQISFSSDNINRSLTASPKWLDSVGQIGENPHYSWWSYGAIYNYYTATAGNADFSTGAGNVAGDLCPSGWHMPTGGETGDYAEMSVSLGGEVSLMEYEETVGSAIPGTLVSNNLRQYPNNFIFSGYYRNAEINRRSTYGKYWSSTVLNQYAAYGLGLYSKGVNPGLFTDSYHNPDGTTHTLGDYNKSLGYAIRCVASGEADNPAMAARVKINKVDSETLSADARGSVSVAGSKYGVYTSGGIRISTITIGYDENGNATGDGTGVSADEIPEGNDYYIQEYDAATGYELDDTQKLTFSVLASDAGTTIDLTSSSDVCTANSTSACYFTDDITKGKFKFSKVGYQLSDSGEASTRNLSGIYFTAVNKADSNITYTIGPTGADGYVESPAMIYGKYTVTEIPGDGNAAYTMASFDATISSTTTGRNIPYNTKVQNSIEDNPSLSTRARNSLSTFESPSNELELSGTAGITDRITCSGLSADHKYKFVGYLWDIAAQAKVTTGTGTNNDVVGEVIFTTTSSGDCPANLDMVFPTFDSYLYRTKALGIVQYLYKNNGTTTDDWVLIAIHNADLSDTAEQLTTKDIEISTTASDKADGDRSVAAGNVIVLDAYSIIGLRNGENYTIVGYLKDSSNNTVATSTDSFTMTLTTGTTYTNTMELSFDSSNYTGQTLSVYQELKDSSGAVIATHNDNLSDANESVTVLTPAISTVAVSGIDNTSKKLPVGRAPVKDTISYTGLVPGDTYYLSGRIIRKRDNSVVAQKINHSFVPSSENGSEVVTFDVFDTTFYYDYASGTNQEEFLVQEWLTRDQATLDALVDGGSNLAKHTEDNADQTVGIVTPEISTTATNKADGTHSLGISNEITISDRVQYSGLVKDDWYKLVGTLVDVASCTNPADVSTCSPLEVDGHVVQGSKSFKAAAGGAGTETIEITLNTINLQGKTLVMFEQLYRDKDHHDDERLIAVHEDTSDTDQTLTVKVISITTTASDKADGDNVLAYKAGQIIKDVIHYENLLPNTKYTLKGCLYNKTAGAMLLDSDGDVICQVDSFTTGDNAASGNYTMEFNLDASDLPGIEIVVFESLFYGDTTDEDSLIAKHENPDAPSQTVKVAIRVGTTAADLYDGDQTVGVGKVTVVDKLKYEGTTVGKTYKAKGWLVHQDTGEPAYGIEVVCETDDSDEHADEEDNEDDGNENEDENEDEDHDEELEDEPTGASCTHNRVAIAAEKTFVVGEEGTEETTGIVELEFVFDNRELIGKNLVVYEELYLVNDDGTETLVADHKDLSDDSQTIEVAVPTIHTVATDKSDGDKELANDGTVVIIDRVEYTGLVADTTYTLYGRLIDKDTGEPIAADGAIVSFVFTPSRDAGSENIMFTIDATGLDGKKLVVFETLYIGEDEEIIEDDIIAKHADLNDEDQTVWVKVNNPDTGRFTRSTDGAKQAGLYVALGLVCVVSFGSWITWRIAKRRKVAP